MTKPMFKTTPTLHGKEAEGFVRMAEENVNAKDLTNNNECDSDKMVKLLTSMKLSPESGYGNIIINFQNFKIVNVEKKESIKL